MTTTTITPADVHLFLRLRQEIALVDLREEAAFATGHPLFASQIPVSRLELEIEYRVPRRDCLIVLFDDGEGLPAIARARLAQRGYTNIKILEGGLAGWQAAGYELFQDVNSYSKAFGELVEARRHTPAVAAPELLAMIESDANMVVLDARRFDEYATMNIPTSTSVPGAELVLRATSLAPDPETAIIVNCAGRTRSIIGTQSLINAGLPNPIMALRNGTIGWTLAGQTLTHGQTRRAPDVDEDAARQARARARAVSYRAGVKRVTPTELAAMADDGTRTLYRFDVRSPEEYVAGHLPDFIAAPGGQLVQETDMFAAVRGARIVLADDAGVRADMTASWLAQMGWEVYVLEGGFGGPLETGEWQATRPPLPRVEEVSHDQLEALLEAGAWLVDLARSPVHRKGHVARARFGIRTYLKPGFAGANHLIFTSPDGDLARLACAEHPGARVLAGGTNAWIAAGRPVETGLENPITPPIDVYKRPYEGMDNRQEAMQAYLDWEFGLVAQLEKDASHGFFVI